MINIDINKMLNHDFYNRNTEIVAKDLIGKILVKKIDNKILAARIVETEAYLPENDPASHSFIGKTKRNQAMFEKAGTLYVYTIYGVHRCINFVTEEEYRGAAVLIRAAEPIMGIEEMKRYREKKEKKLLCKGPANLAKSFNFSIYEDRKSLFTDELFVFEDADLNYPILRSSRIGISKGIELKLRFFLKDSEFISANNKGEPV